MQNNGINQNSKNEQSGNSTEKSKPIIPMLDLSVIHGVNNK